MTRKPPDLPRTMQVGHKEFRRRFGIQPKLGYLVETWSHSGTWVNMASYTVRWRVERMDDEWVYLERRDR